MISTSPDPAVLNGLGVKTAVNNVKSQTLIKLEIDFTDAANVIFGQDPVYFSLNIVYLVVEIHIFKSLEISFNIAIFFNTYTKHFCASSIFEILYRGIVNLQNIYICKITKIPLHERQHSLFFPPNLSSEQRLGMSSTNC